MSFLSTASSYLLPDWKVPSNIRAVSTYRFGGGSQPPYDSFNFGLHTGDDSISVMGNRQKLADDWELAAENIGWLNQVHSTTVVQLPLPQSHSRQLPDADGSFSSQKNQPCVVMTADCLPVLLTDTNGFQVAALHAGWRGLCDGVIEQGVSCFSSSQNIIAWLGPAIGPSAFEVGADVFSAFTSKQKHYSTCFESLAGRGLASPKWYANIYELARLELARLGVKMIFGGNRCTYSEKDSFFSYRRDGATGRMATMIWRE